MNRIFAALASSAFLFLGCMGGSGLGPGDSAEVEITSESPELGSALQDAYEVLLYAGIPADPGAPVEELDLKAGGITVIEARGSGRTDPIIAVVENGRVLAANDDWEQGPGSRIVLEEVPKEAQLLVWDADGRTGAVTVELSAGDQADLSRWENGATLASGTMTSSIPDEKSSEAMRYLIEDLDAEGVYASGYENARLVPFTVEEDARYSVLLSSGDFDAYLVLVSLERGRAEFLDVNDDGGGGTDSRILAQLEPGLYGALVMSYFGDSGSFELSLQKREEGYGDAIPVSVPGEATGSMADACAAVEFWEYIDSDWHYSSINGNTPVLAFTFVITEEGDYHIGASAEFDATLTLASLSEYGDPVFMDYSDDFDGSDPGLIMWLSPGEMIALVADYWDSESGDVAFFVERMEPYDPEPVPMDLDREYTLTISHNEPYGLFELEMIGGYVYALSAFSENQDPVITITFADGSELFDDDGGEGLNSYLEFVPQESQLGIATINVGTYHTTDAGSITASVTRLERLSEQEVFSLYD